MNHIATLGERGPDQANRRKAISTVPRPGTFPRRSAWGLSQAAARHVCQGRGRHWRGQPGGVTGAPGQRGTMCQRTARGGGALGPRAGGSQRRVNRNKKGGRAAGAAASGRRLEPKLLHQHKRIRGGGLGRRRGPPIRKENPPKGTLLNSFQTIQWHPDKSQCFPRPSLLELILHIIFYIFYI